MWPESEIVVPPTGGSEHSPWLEVQRAWGDWTIEVDPLRAGDATSFAGCSFSHLGLSAQILFPSSIEAGIEPDGDRTDWQQRERIGKVTFGAHGMGMCQVSEGQRLHPSFPPDDPAGTPRQCIASLTPAECAVGRGLLCRIARAVRIAVLGP